MDGAKFNINEAVSSLVARFGRSFGEIAIRGRYLSATALDVVKAAESVTHLE